jgi:hypothetical protein
MKAQAADSGYQGRSPSCLDSAEGSQICHRGPAAVTCTRMPKEGVVVESAANAGGVKAPWSRLHRQPDPVIVGLVPAAL